MVQFAVHTAETAPPASQAALRQIADRYGFVPNLAGVFAESPGAMKALLGLLAAYDAEEISLTPIERQVVLLAVSVRNRCAYCTAAHSMLASMFELSDADIDNLHQGRPLSDDKLEALRRFAEILVDKRGWASSEDIEAFLVAGFPKAAVFDVILGVAVKTLTNYANHVAKPPINEQFAQFSPKWADAA